MNFCKMNYKPEQGRLAAEFKCNLCGHVWIAVYHIKITGNLECPKCGKFNTGIVYYYN